MLIFYFNLKNLIIFSLFISITLFSLSKDTNLKHRYIDLTKNTFKFVYEKIIMMNCRLIKKLLLK